MYTPTKTELEELGFTKDIGLVINDNIIYKELGDTCGTIVYTQGCKMELTLNFGESIPIYPRSLDHLKQIILAFNPTE